MKALITGSFDPITKGHMDIIYKAEELFTGENLTVVVMDNLDKTNLLSLDQRMSLVRESLPEYIDVISHKGMLNKLFDKFDYPLIVVRGLRNSIDYEYEKSVEVFTKSFDVNTIYINSSPETQHISSSLIRNLIKAEAGYTIISPLMPDVMTYELMDSFLSTDWWNSE